jgi:RHS repeat-associated protein
MGNRLWIRDPVLEDVDRIKSNSLTPETGQLTATVLGTSACGTPPCHPAWYVYEHSQTHDAAGNVDATWGKETRGGASNPEVVPEETRSYHSADDKLMYFNRQFGLIDPGKPESVFEEYRYDALGRRVFTRSRRPSNCPSPCPAYAERTVWDGDQVLMELRSSGGTADTLFLDGDGAARDSISRPLFGVVTYLHAQGIDQPLGVLKKYADVETWKYVTPHANWRGEYSNGTFANGDDCLTVSDDCPHWPGFQRTGDRGELGPQPQTYAVWWGNLLSGRAEASGLQYLRNRYYDAKTGRFTQLDPIGLAGGVNLYGFGDGDPVNFDDPFGLQGCKENPNGDECRFIRGVALGFRERVIETGSTYAGMIVAGIGSRLVQGVQRLLGRIGSAIPDEAAAVAENVERTGAAPAGYRGGRAFLNDGRGGGQILPARTKAGDPISYKEYDISPFREGVSRGSERVVIGSDGSRYYTSDHYRTFHRF